MDGKVHFEGLPEVHASFFFQTEDGIRDVGVTGVQFFSSSRRRHTRCSRDWSSDVCSSDLAQQLRQKIARDKDVVESDLFKFQDGERHTTNL